MAARPSKQSTRRKADNTVPTNNRRRRRQSDGWTVSDAESSLFSSTRENRSPRDRTTTDVEVGLEQTDHRNSVSTIPFTTRQHRGTGQPLDPEQITSPASLVNALPGYEVGPGYTVVEGSPLSIMSQTPLVTSMPNPSSKTSQYRSDLRNLQGDAAFDNSFLKHVTTLLAQKTQASVSKPRFDGEEYPDPNLFLERFVIYAKNQQYPESDWLLAVFDCLRGRPAKWALLSRDAWASFEEFRVAFLRMYWSEDQQYQLRRKITEGKYYTHGRLSMADYFINLVSRAKYLSNPIPEINLITDVMHHFPVEVQAIWTHIGKKTVQDTIHFLCQHEIFYPKTSRTTWVNPSKSKSNKEDMKKPSSPGFTYTGNSQPTSRYSSGRKQWTSSSGAKFVPGNTPSSETRTPDRSRSTAAPPVEQRTGVLKEKN